MGIHVDTNALLNCLTNDLSPFLGKDPLVAQPHEIASDILLGTLLKKYEPKGVSEAASTAAVAKFLEINKRSLGFKLNPNTSNEEEFLGLLKDELYRFWYIDAETALVDSSADIFHEGGVGPGAAAEGDGCDFYTKVFAGTLAGSRDTWAWWWDNTDRDIRWRAAMNRRTELGLRNAVRSHSTVSVAPKTADIGRTFFTQPAVSLWGQKGVGSLIERRLRQLYNLDLTKQEGVNQLMAQEGSFSQKFATIDSTSASDTISREGLCREILPKHMFKMLDFFRCKSVQIPGKGRVRLGMMSEMGNGFNFPLQTLIFSCVIRATYRQAGLKPAMCGDLASPGAWGVYGDDMIVVGHLAPRVLRYMELCGFLPNRSKTYVEGRFRESCGADFIDGTFVRGVYIKRLRSNEHLYVTINSLLAWSAQHEIALRQTLRFLRSHIKGHAYMVPLDEDAAAGMKIPSALLKEKLSPPDSMGFRKYWARVPLTRAISLTLDGIQDADGQRLPENFSGLMLVGLRGDIRSNRICLRQRAGVDVRYTTDRSKATPRWDYFELRAITGDSNRSYLRRLTNAWTAAFR